MFEKRIKERLENHHTRIVLRKFEEKDIDMVYTYGSDKETIDHLRWGGVTSKREAEDVVRTYYRKTKTAYAIPLKENDLCIGAIDFHIKEEHEKAEFGYVLHKSYWGQGYASEALFLILQHCFHDIGLQRVEGSHNKENIASGRVMQKYGMTYEGLCKREEKVKGKYVDIVHYGMLKEDFIIKEKMLYKGSNT